MTTPQAQRVTRELTPEEQARLRRHREQIAAELPELNVATTYVGADLIDEVGGWPKRHGHF